MTHMTAQTEPNWAPLEARIPLDQCGSWMWMGRVERAGRIVEQYKHRESRGCLNLDERGEAWRVSYTYDGCDPWCPEDHEHRKFSSAPHLEPIRFDDALAWALS